MDLTTTPADQWWSCSSCDTHWWGTDLCWCCQQTNRVTPARPPDFMSTACAMPVIRPEWSNQP